MFRSLLRDVTLISATDNRIFSAFWTGAYNAVDMATKPTLAVFAQSPEKVKIKFC